MKEYLKGEPDPLAPASYRGIQSNDPRAVRRYCEHLENLLDQSGIEKDFEDVRESIEKYGYNNVMGETLDLLDEKMAAI